MSLIFSLFLRGLLTLTIKMAGTTDFNGSHEITATGEFTQGTSGRVVQNPQDGDYSTLEARRASPGLYDSFKQAVHQQPRPLPPDQMLPEAYILAEKAPYQKPKRGQRICHLRRKWFWTFAILAVFVIAAVAGALVGTHVHRAKGKDKQNTPSASSGHPAPTVKMINATALASVAWNDTDNNPHYRLYWQGEDNSIRESSYKITQQNWTVSPSPIGYAKPNSPLAAVVTGPAGFPFVSRSPSRKL